MSGAGRRLGVLGMRRRQAGVWVTGVRRNDGLGLRVIDRSRGQQVRDVNAISRCSGCST